MEEHILLPADLPYRGHILDHADLVVHMHERHQHGVAAHGVRDLLRMHDAVRIWLEERDFEPFTLELLQRIEHRLVLGACRDDVLAAISIEPCNTEQGQVVRFGGTRSPHDGIRRCSDGARDLRTRLFHQRASAVTIGVTHRRRVAVSTLRSKAFDHAVRHARIHGRRRRIVQIDGCLSHFAPLCLPQDAAGPAPP